MVTTAFIGIDVGLGGAIAHLSGDGLRVWDMPVLAGARKKAVSAVLLADLLREIQTPDCQVVVERVGARPGQGVSSMFSFGQGYGIVIGVVAALGLPLTLVTPQEWKRAMRVQGGKDASRLRILELRPESAGLFSRKRDHGRADATLIALHGKMKCSFTDTRE